jgi:hypothetical protein
MPRWAPLSHQNQEHAGKPKGVLYITAHLYVPRHSVLRDSRFHPLLLQLQADLHQKGPSAPPAFI